MTNWSKYIFYFSNLNNLSNIIKNKNKNIASKINKNLTTENLFLYKNIVSSCNTRKSNSGNNLKNKDEHQMNNGFIMDNNAKKICPSIQSSEESRKNPGEICLGMELNNLQEKKINDISQKLDSMKSPYNIYNSGAGSTSNL